MNEKNYKRILKIMYDNKTKYYFTGNLYKGMQIFWANPKTARRNSRKAKT
jgi:hypothetical protein